MKFHHQLFALLLAISSCTNAVKNPSKTVSKEDTETISSLNLQEPILFTSARVVMNQDDLYGYWVGDFEPDLNILGDDYQENMEDDETNKINISIDSFAGDEVFGHSVVAGLRRPFVGTKKKKENLFSFEVKEPGDNQYDGVFLFSITKGDSVMKGTWSAYNKIKTSFRAFEVKKKFFTFNPDQVLEYTYRDQSKTKSIKAYDEEDEEYLDNGMLSSTQKIFDYNPSKVILSESELRELTKGDLIILRNSIYAKHGYSFKKRSLRNYFDDLDWYMPVYIDIKPFLTDIEKTNIKNMLKHEKYAEEFYDVFGR